MTLRQAQKANLPRNGVNRAFNPALPLAHHKRELFSQRVAAGESIKTAAALAGYNATGDSPRKLRRHPDVEARINWLLMYRVESDTKARHKRDEKLGSLKDRVIRELERVAFADARDVVQWDRKPTFDAEGNVTGFEDVLTTTPSHALTAEQAASVKSLKTKGGTVQVELHDKLAALEKLGKALGIFQESAPPVQQVTVNQVNVGNEPALELARRLAFAMATVARPMIDVTTADQGKPLEATQEPSRNA